MKMKKERALELWQDKLTGEISEVEEKELAEFLSSDNELTKELGQLEHTWDLFDDIKRPDPSDQMDMKFEGMLAGYMAASSKRSRSWADVIIIKLQRSWQVGLATLVLGLFIGWWMMPQNDKDMDQLSGEIQDMKRLMMMTLIEQPKAQDRIRAVSMASELPSVDEKVIEALITTLNHDDNLNVRLAALESLVIYGNMPTVRHALIDALKMQESTIMLVGIADALVAIQEKSSLDTMEELRDTTTDDIVKEKLSESIETLTNI